MTEVVQGVPVGGTGEVYPGRLPGGLQDLLPSLTALYLTSRTLYMAIWPCIWTLYGHRASWYGLPVPPGTSRPPGVLDPIVIKDLVEGDRDGSVRPTDPSIHPTDQRVVIV